MIEATAEETSTPQNDEGQAETNIDPSWKPVIFNIPNDGIWSQPDDSIYTANGDDADSFAWSRERIEGDFTLQVDVESAFGHYGAGTIVIYGDGQSWSDGCLIFAINGFWRSIRIDSIYFEGDEKWLDYRERTLTNRKYTMTIEVSGDTATLYANNILVASTTIPERVERSGKIGLFKYWGSAKVTYSNILIQIP